MKKPNVCWKVLQFGVLSIEQIHTGLQKNT